MQRGVEDFSGDSGGRYVGPWRDSFLSRFGPTSESKVSVPAFQHQRFCGDWQLITANINKISAVGVDHTVTRLLNPEFVRADLPVILALQEASSWDVRAHFSPCV